MAYLSPGMPVNSTHSDYDENLEAWLRIRDVLAGDRAIKRAGAKYVARLDSQTDEEFRAYVERGFFYNATSRTVSGYVGMIFRRDPVLQLPDKSVALHPALRALLNDVDLLGTTLDSYAKNIINDVVSLIWLNTVKRAVLLRSGKFLFLPVSRHRGFSESEAGTLCSCGYQC